MPGPRDRVRSDEFALIVIDPQERLASAMPDPEAAVAATARLIRLARLVSAPIVATRQYPKGLGDLVDPVRIALDDAATDGGAVEVLDKTAFCACRESAFVDAVEDTRRRQMVVAGMETHICVTQTALDLLDRGHAVHVVADACCSRDPRMHDLALDRMRAAGAVVTVSESVMYEAVPQAGTPEFKALLEIVKS